MARYVYRCPECRTRRLQSVLMQAHQVKHGHRVCTCGGYHHKHRKGSPYCHHNKLSPIREAWRHSESECVIQGLAHSITEERPELADQVRELCARFGIQIQLKESV